ncbi:MAG: HAD family hydrolase [Bacteroidales bacterium]|nr:HAD family hydrolase [Bacteroidales bacterium]
MEKNYLEYIGKFLGETPEMKPVPTQLKPCFQPDASIRACVFDVYGTLMISDSGDIEESVITTANMKTALDAAGIVLTRRNPESVDVLSEMLESFKREVALVHQRDKAEDKPYPEIDILSVWERIIVDHSNKNNLIVNGSLCIKCFTFVFEVLSNRIYPMPGMREVITHLAERQMPLGIVSNAQFYTPVILNYFMNGSVSESELVPPFDEELTIFSYQFKRSKPDSYLFEMLKVSCHKKYGIYPDEILFVGNDMFRDVYPAHLAGLKTVLFAGDMKSLRMRDDRTELKSITPDFIITDLRQVLKIIV